MSAERVEKAALGCGASILTGFLGGIVGAFALAALFYFGTDSYRGNDFVMAIFVGLPVGFVAGGIIGAGTGAVLALRSRRAVGSAHPTAGYH